MHCLTRAQNHICARISASPEKTGIKRSHRITDCSSKEGWNFNLKHPKITQTSTLSLQVFKQRLVAR